MTNKSNHFIIQTNNAVDQGTLGVYIEEMLEFASSIGLSYKRFPFAMYGVKDIEVGHYISVGTSSEFDIDYITRRGYITENGYKPVYDLVKDFNEIKKALLKYAIGGNVPVELHCGSEVTFHRGFVKISTEGGTAIVKNEELVALAQRSMLLGLFR